MTENRKWTFADGLNRRQFVLGTGALLTSPWPVSGNSLVNSLANRSGPETLTGTEFDLTLGTRTVDFTGRQRTATTVNSSLPAPILRWREGERVTLRVRNELDVNSSLHWHGLILPPEMDGVPGLSFSGIEPGGTYRYEFDVQQNGTYWYHSHSGFQEQTGMYGAIVIDAADPEPFTYDREHVVLLSDWSDVAPERIYRNLKIHSEYYSRTERTVGDLTQEVGRDGIAATWRNRFMWNRMRMSDRDLADVTGLTYTYLMNGVTPQPGWYGESHGGERIRLRIINGSAMTYFDFRIPGLKMTVVAADGQYIQPVSVDEFRIGVAETYDVIVEPEDNRAYTLFAQAIDRSGFALGTLAPEPSQSALVPALDPVPSLTHADMGMHGHGSSHDSSEHAGMAHGAHETHTVETPGPAGFGSTAPVVHPLTERGPGVTMQAETPQSRLDDPGPGLRNNGRRVLVYADLKNLTPTLDSRDPDREIQLHLTGNMSRYIWSIDGVDRADAEPILLQQGERVRFTFINDTMMYHPMHLHGMWSELETGDPDYLPRKHTVNVPPGSKVSYLLTADAPGSWAFHCHMLFHMPGMFRSVVVNAGATS